MAHALCLRIRRRRHPWRQPKPRLCRSRASLVSLLAGRGLLVVWAEGCRVVNIDIKNPSKLTGVLYIYSLPSYPNKVCNIGITRINRTVLRVTTFVENSTSPFP